MYFAWLREKIGAPAETLLLPPAIETVGDLITWLQSRSPGHQAAFANAKLVRCALDQEFAGHDAPIGQTTEIAFFPPVTGG